MIRKRKVIDVFNSKNYRDVLRHEFLERIAVNPRYSLRAFARDLGISASRLSDVLNKKGNLSRRSGTSIAGCLNFNDAETELFLALVDSENVKSLSISMASKKRVEQLRTESPDHRIHVDHFDLIGDWYHFAILELMTLNAMQNSIPWIARKLDVSVIEIKIAMERLERLGFIRNDAGKYELIVANSSTKSGAIPSKAVTKAHSQFLQKALTSLHRTPLIEREFGSLVLAINSSKIKLAKKLIRDFRKDFNLKMGSHPKKDKVYCLSTQFFQLDKNI